MTDQELDAETRAALGEADDEVSDDPEVVVLVEDIELTREEMTGTVEEIGDRLDPRNIVEGAKETVRAATVGKVEDMANSAGAMVGEAGDTVREAGSGIVDTITKNPVPAAMVGLGLGWLFMNRQQKPSWQKHSTMDRYRTSGEYRPGGDYATSGDSGTSNGPSLVDQAGRKAGHMADQVGSTVGQAADQVGSTVGQAADQVGQMASQVPYRVETTARQIGDQAGRLFQGSPLAVGAIAVAVGAAVGMVLPVTETEKRALQQPARQALAKVEDVATDALEQVEQKAQGAEQQAIEEDRQARPH